MTTDFTFPSYAQSLNVKGVRSLIELSEKDYDYLIALVQNGTKTDSRLRIRGKILLLLHNHRTMKEVATFLQISNPTIQKVKDRFLRSSLAEALNDKQRSGRPVVFNEIIKTNLYKLSLTKAPNGAQKWTLRKLADAAVEQKIVDKISHQQVKNILKSYVNENLIVA